VGAGVGDDEQSRLIILSQYTVQGGSDKSGILKIYFETHTAQLKIIRFIKVKKNLTERQIGNQFFQ